MGWSGSSDNGKDVFLKMDNCAKMLENQYN